MSFSFSWAVLPPPAGVVGQAMLNVLSSCTTREGRWLKALFSTPPCRLCPPTVCVHVAREGSVGAKDPSICQLHPVCAALGT